jgi:hypothetical protein
MNGGIPPYGAAGFRLVSHLPYNTMLASRRYELKADPRWYTRSLHNSKVWIVYGPAWKTGMAPATVTSLTEAMALIAATIAR